MNAVPPARRGIASGISATLFNVGFLASLAMAFGILATSMPLAVLQAIFAGQAVPNGQIDVGLFMDAFHAIFWIMVILSLVAAIPSSLRGSRTTGSPPPQAKGLSPPGPMH